MTFTPTAKNREAFLKNALAHTGIFARKILGFNYDKDQETGKLKRPGGIRASGPYKTMTSFMDRRSPRRKLLLAPRGSYKSTLMTAFAIRCVVQNRNVRVLYGMETYANAQKKTAAIKRHFTDNPKLIEAFGDLKGPLWGRSEFTLIGRTDPGLVEPSFSAFGLEKVVTGGHYDIILLDDLVSWQNSRTAEGLEKPKAALRDVQFLLDPGGIIIVAGTRYHDDDLYGYIERKFKTSYDILCLDAGVEMEHDPIGEREIRLVGEPTFPHIDRSQLYEKLDNLDNPAYFAAQYLNRIITTSEQLFFRHQFRYETFSPWMEGMNAYIMTDTATTDNEIGCYSVIACVMMDGDDIAYLADLSVGRWQPGRVVEEILGMYTKWTSRVCVKGIVMEKIALNKVFASMMENEGKRRHINFHIFNVSRGPGTPSKRQRIRALHRRFASDRFRVLDTVPRYCCDGREILFDPEGFVDSENNHLPSGMLVDQFIRFPVCKYLDIPDALADIESVGTDGVPIVQRTFRRRTGSRWELGAVPRDESHAPGGILQGPPAGRQNFWRSAAGRIR